MQSTTASYERLYLSRLQRHDAYIPRGEGCAVAVEMLSVHCQSMILTQGASEPWAHVVMLIILCYRAVLRLQLPCSPTCMSTLATLPAHISMVSRYASVGAMHRLEAIVLGTSFLSVALAAANMGQHGIPLPFCTHHSYRASPSLATVQTSTNHCSWPPD